MVEVYPSGTGVEDEVGFLVCGEGVDGNTGVGVFQDEVDECLCGGGFGLVGVSVDVAGDDGGGPDPRKVDTSGVSYAALVSVAEFSASKTSGAERLHQECRRRVL